MNSTAGQELVVLIIIGVILLCFYLSRKGWQGSGTAHGTARWGDKKDLLRKQMLGDGDGLIIGRELETGELIRHPKYTHLSVFAPTGAGKGVSYIVPWLLTYNRGSVVVFDPKGENYNLTGEKRRALGQKVIRLDPFGVCGPGADMFNPLDLIGQGQAAIDDARAFSEALVLRSGQEHDPYWNDQAANVLTAVIALVASYIASEDRSLSTVREIVTDANLFQQATERLQDAGGIFGRLAGILASLQDKERAGVLSTVNRHTTFLDSLAIGDATEKSSFDVRELLQGNVTIYVILPPSQIEAQSRWLRLNVASLIRMIGQHGMAKDKECLMVLDEAGQIGHMEPLEQGLTLLRGYGLKMAFFFQSLGQLKECFKEKEAVLLDNTEQVYFGTQSYETAERVSKMLGDATITIETFNNSESRSWQQGGANDHGGVQVNTTTGRNYSEQGRALMRPEEVLQMHDDLVVAFLRGVPPILARRVKWFADPLFGSGGVFSGGPPQLLLWALLIGAAAAVAYLCSTMQ